MRHFQLVRLTLLFALSIASTEIAVPGQEPPGSASSNMREAALQAAASCIRNPEALQLIRDYIAQISRLDMSKCEHRRYALNTQVSSFIADKARQYHEQAIDRDLQSIAGICTNMTPLFEYMDAKRTEFARVIKDAPPCPRIYRYCRVVTRRDDLRLREFPHTETPLADGQVLTKSDTFKKNEVVFQTASFGNWVYVEGETRSGGGRKHGWSSKEFLDCEGSRR